MPILELRLIQSLELSWLQTRRLLVGLPAQFDVCEGLIDLSEKFGAMGLTSFFCTLLL